MAEPTSYDTLPQSSWHNSDNMTEETPNSSSNDNVVPAVEPPNSNNNPQQQQPPNETATTVVTTVNARELTYAVDSYYAIVQPVFITMILAALSAVYINTPESSAATEQALNVYTVIDTEPDDNGESSASQIGTSVVNALVIVSVIGALTFVIVLLYKYRCMKCLIGYMVVSSALLLGFLAAQMLQVAIDKYQWTAIDKVSFWFVMYNFAITGCVAIFAPMGAVPRYVSQGYLIATSVIVAWQLSHFSETLAWALLVMLALYDLFAVLTPCGPLKALVNLMQREDAPDMPGLLYEASLPNAAQQQQRNNNNNRSNHSSTQQQQQHRPSVGGDTASETEDEEEPRRQEAPIPEAASTPNNDTEPVTVPSSSSSSSPLVQASIHDHETSSSSSSNNNNNAQQEIEFVTSQVPLALAKLYKIRLLHDPQPYWITGNDPVDYTPQQLTELVDVVFDARGGRIVPTATLDDAPAAYRRNSDREETRYTIVGSRGEHRRVLFVNREGRIFEDLRVQNEEEERKERTSIKLGLGDFIFYSILVSKAALYSFTTFAVCSLAILAGLGLTLLLLAMYGKALPALPISIALGVIFYLTTRFMAEPWVHEIFLEQVYV